MIVRNLLKSLRINDQGTTAVEFAIVAPVFITLLIGTLALCVTLFLIGSLHYAAEEGARCASVKTACQVNGIPDAAATQTYAQNHYFRPERTHLYIRLCRLRQFRERVDQLFDECGI
jgi:Flp pilus assembly protein TadG